MIQLTAGSIPEFHRKLTRQKAIGTELQSPSPNAHKCSCQCLPRINHEIQCEYLQFDNQLPLDVIVVGSETGALTTHKHLPDSPLRKNTKERRCNVAASITSTILSYLSWQSFRQTSPLVRFATQPASSIRENCIKLTRLQRITLGAGEMAQQLGVLVFLHRTQVWYPQHPHGDPQPSITPIPKDPTPSCDLQQLSTHVVQIPT